MPTYVSTVALRVTFAAWLLAVSAGASAQPAKPPSPMERSEPHEALTFYEGTWTILEDKEHASYRDTCSWLPEGRRHIVCKARAQTPNGPIEALGIYSYDQASGEYLYHGFNAGGRVSIDRGQRTPTGFLFLKEAGTGADRTRERFTLEEQAGGRVIAVTETAKADGPWVVDDRTIYLRTRQ
jgi:hypothetical protein